MNLRYAMAEEGILYCLMKNPDFWKIVSARISEQDFVTDVNREIYRSMGQILEEGKPPEMMELSAVLSPSQMGRVSAILAGAPSQRCDEEGLNDYLRILLEHKNEKTEQEVAQMDDDALEEYVKHLAAKKNRRS